MEKRLVIFLILSIFIIFLYPYFMTWLIGPLPQTPPPVTKEGKQDLPKEPTADEKPLVGGTIVDETIAHVDEVEGLETEGAVEEVTEKLKVIESDLYRVTLSNIGGTIKKWELKKYTEPDEEGNEIGIQLAPDSAEVFPLSLYIEDEARNEDRIYQLDEGMLRLNEDRPEGRVRMVFIGSEGRKIIKEVKFYNNKYLVDLEITTDGYDQGYSLSLGTNFGIHEWGKQIGRGAGAISLINGEVIRDVPAKIEGEVIHEGEPKWIGLQDKYFLSALIPEKPAEISMVSIEGEGESTIISSLKVRPDHGGVSRFSLYSGPKEYDRLRGLKANLDESIDFGWFIFGSWLPVRLIAKPIFYLLRFFYRFTNNYGVAIILVTVLVKSILFPVTRKSLKSMKAMSTIQPKVTAIRKKWAKDKERLNRELINLYKVEKINPLGGCFPMLIQIPVFISLFNILYTTIDLRQAPFMFWIKDLAQKDPYYVLPVIMGASMLLQQHTQPTTMEPGQANMMKFLPAVYTFFFLNFPSGLVLYWLVNNILSIGQQYLIKRESDAKE